MLKSLFLFSLQTIGSLLNPVVAIVFLIIGYQIRPTIEPVIKQVEQVRELQKLIPTGEKR